MVDFQTLWGTPYVLGNWFLIGDHWLFVRIAKRYCCSGTKNPFFHIKYIFMALLKAIDLLRQGAFFGIRNPHTVFQKSIFVQLFKLKKKSRKFVNRNFGPKLTIFNGKKCQIFEFSSFTQKWVFGQKFDFLNTVLNPHEKSKMQWCTRCSSIRSLVFLLKSMQKIRFSNNPKNISKLCSLFIQFKAFTIKKARESDATRMKVALQLYPRKKGFQRPWSKLSRALRCRCRTGLYSFRRPERWSAVVQLSLFAPSKATKAVLLSVLSKTADRQH